MQKNGRGQKIKVSQLDKEIGYLIKETRKKIQHFTDKSFTQKYVAEKIGLTPQQYIKYENGKNKVSITMLLKILCAFEMNEEEQLAFVLIVIKKYKELNK